MRRPSSSNARRASARLPRTMPPGRASLPTNSVDRLVQDFTRRGVNEERQRDALEEVLTWVNAAFAGNPQDVQTWPRLDPLASHVFAAVQHGDGAGIAEPPARLLDQLGVLFPAKPGP